MSDSKLDDLRLEFFAKKEAAADILLFASKFECEPYEVIGIALDLLKVSMNFQDTGQKVGAFHRGTGTFTEFVLIGKDGIARIGTKAEHD